MWKVTLSKSETTWSIDEGVELGGGIRWWPCYSMRGESILWLEAVFEQGFDEDVLVVEEQHGAVRLMPRRAQSRQCLVFPSLKAPTIALLGEVGYR